MGVASKNAFKNKDLRDSLKVNSELEEVGGTAKVPKNAAF
jgi:hypothetical protein